MNRFLLYSGLVVALLSANATATAQEGVQNIQGNYSAPSHCYRREGQGTVPCDASMHDCLSIKSIDRNRAEVEILSAQGNSSVCELKGIAEVTPQMLRYTLTKIDDPDQSAKGLVVEIIEEGGEIKIRYVKPPSYQQDPFCGINATLDGLEFKLNTKKPVGSEACP